MLNISELRLNSCEHGAVEINSFVYSFTVALLSQVRSLWGLWMADHSATFCNLK